MTYIPLHRDPERWRYRYDEAVRQFKAKEITQTVFGAVLYTLGFRGNAILTEINLHMVVDENKPLEKQGTKNFFSGLPDRA